MVDVNIASNTEYVENRQASGYVQYACDEGDLLGIDSNGDTVQADAASGASQAAARGVALGPAKDPANYGNDFSETKLVVEANYDLVGESRKTYFEFGVRVRNADEDWDFTPNEPVYLDKAGGFTQDLSAHGAGDLKQIVGYAKLGSPDAAGAANEVVINIHEAEEISDGSATFSGDATGGKTTFNIAHGLSYTPSRAVVTATSADASGDFYISAIDGTNITVEYGSAPADGTDNVTMDWAAYE